MHRTLFHSLANDIAACRGLELLRDLVLIVRHDWTLYSEEGSAEGSVGCSARVSSGTTAPGGSFIGREEV